MKKMERASFKLFRDNVYKLFAEMSAEDYLFRTDTDPERLWDIYLSSFPAGTNEIYKVRPQYDCSTCRHFVKQMGNIVAIKDGNLVSIWDIYMPYTQFAPVAEALSAYVKFCPIKDVFVTYENRVGCDKNYGMDGSTPEVFEHFYLDVPKKFVKKKDSIPTYLNDTRTQKQVFRRSLEELTLESIDTVLELIAQNSLYRGAEWQSALNVFRGYKVSFDELETERQRNMFAWKNSLEAGPVVGRIRNHSIGVLLTDISADVELDEAVRRYEAVVAPQNYKRPKAIFTKRMLEDAQKKVQELGLMDSLPRRFATLDDITANNILFSNKDAAKRISGSVFDEMAASIPTSPKKFSNVESIKASDFVSKVLPTATEVELMLEPRHVKNMVSLIAPVNKDAPTMFKWNNPFSWAYTGNIADSDIRQNVKSAGGKVDGVLRFSIQWNDEKDYNCNDFDAHCIEPSDGEHIYFNHKRSRTGGNLDVDIIGPKPGVPAVENITWPKLSAMKHGLYQLYVHCYCNRGGRSGFKAEIEFGGQIFRFEYPHELCTGKNVPVADVFFDGQSFQITEKLPVSVSSRDVWGLKTNTFIPVSVICYSPNYWDEQHGIGNQHYFFMLKDCINPEQPNGMYNEYLRQELLEHKRVFEALGSKMRVEDTADQLSGVGFCTTRRDSVTVKVKGATERVLKVEF